jgi:Big-like domain-containing protein
MLWVIAAVAATLAAGAAVVLFLLPDSDEEFGWTGAEGRAVAGVSCAELPEPDFGFSRLPAIREPAFDIASPYPVPAVRLEGVDGRIVRPGEPYGVALDDYTRNKVTREWRIKGRMLALDGAGAVVEQVSHDKLPTGSGRYDSPSMRIRVGDEPGFYRLDLSVARAGRWSGRYSLYLRAMPPHAEGRLAIGGDTFRPGQSVGMRVENLGSEVIQHGYGAGLEHYEGGEWASVPEERIEPLMGYGVEGGEVGACLPFELSPKLEPGRYRFVKEVSVLKETRGYRDYHLTAEFEVVR